MKDLSKEYEVSKETKEQEMKEFYKEIQYFMSKN